MLILQNEETQRLPSRQRNIYYCYCLLLQTTKVLKTTYSVEKERIDKTYQRYWTNNRLFVSFFLLLVFSFTERLVSARETL